MGEGLGRWGRDLKMGRGLKDAHFKDGRREDSGRGLKDASRKVGVA